MLAVGATWQLASDVLDAVQFHYAEQGETLPAVQYVAPCLPAADCEMLAVHIEGWFSSEGQNISPTGLAHSRRAGHTLKGATVAIYLLRCVHGIELTEGGQPVLPSVSQEEEDAERILRDSVLLANALIDAERDERLGGCHGLVFDTWTSLTNEGGLGGGVLRMRAVLGIA